MEHIRRKQPANHAIVTTGDNTVWLFHPDSSYGKGMGNCGNVNEMVTSEVGFALSFVSNKMSNYSAEEVFQAVERSYGYPIGTINIEVNPEDGTIFPEGDPEMYPIAQCVLGKTIFLVYTCGFVLILEQGDTPEEMKKIFFRIN